LKPPPPLSLLPMTVGALPHTAQYDQIDCETRTFFPDLEWDTFVASVPGGLYAQSSVWAATKEPFGWSPVRIIVKRDRQILAGAQMLIREFVGSLRVAHVLQGPVLASDDFDLFETLLNRLTHATRTRHIHYLALRPPPTCSFVDSLKDWGFHPGSILAGRRATLVLDLLQSEVDILRHMRRTTRSNIRLAQDRGVEVREGIESDIPAFCELMTVTAHRRHFAVMPASYVRNLWTILRKSNNIRLFLAEYHGELLASLLTITFGDTVVAKMLGWSGYKRWLYANELLFWEAIRWSKKNAFTRFDLDGIDASGARAMLDGKPLPVSVLKSGNRFKLGFGGTPVLFQSTHEYVPSHLLSFLLRASSVFGRKNVDTLFKYFVPSR
jgi:peptidoglycan pentaglycine glycine transferase (the first glycine)